MKEKPLILFIEAQANALLNAAHNKPQDSKQMDLALRLVMGVQNQLLKRHDYVFRGIKPEKVMELKLWLERNGQDSGFRFDDRVIKLDESNLTDEERQRLIKATQRACPDYFHARPGRFGILLMRIRNLFCGK